MRTAIIVFIGGGLGSVARWLVSLLLPSTGTAALPWATLLANVTGCFAIGAIAALLGPVARPGSSEDLRQFLAVGLCGGYTTFSAFSLQTISLAQSGAFPKAMLNVALSVALSLFATWLGYFLFARTTA